MPWPIAVTYPDLVIADVSTTDATVNQGATLVVSTTVLNQGMVPSAASKVGFRLSLNDVYGDADDVVLSAHRSVSALDVGESSTGNTTITVPSSTAPNAYYLCAQADTYNTVVEADDDNNAACFSTQVIVPKPDLIASAVSTTANTAEPGDRIRVTISINNQGGSSAGSSIVGYHLSANETYGDGDDIVTATTYTIWSLAIDATKTVARYVRIPANIVAGNYYVCIRADDTDAVEELDENNNAACTATPVTVP